MISLIVTELRTVDTFCRFSVTTDLIRNFDPLPTAEPLKDHFAIGSGFASNSHSVVSVLPSSNIVVAARGVLMEGRTVKLRSRH